LSFRVRGSKGAGTVYFTSIRTEKGVPFTNCAFCLLFVTLIGEALMHCISVRFKVIADDGTVVQLDPSSM